MTPDRPDKPDKEDLISYGPDPEDMARIKKAHDDWTGYIASRMTVQQLRAWLAGNRWGGDNPYPRPRDKAGIARTVATMILDDRFAEPEELK